MLKKRKITFFLPETFSKADYSVIQSVKFLNNSSNPTQMELQFCSFWRESHRT